MAIFPLLQIFLLSLLSFLIILMLSIRLKRISFYSRNKTCNLPPSPPKLPIVGNLHQLGSSPHRSLQALSQKYGPLMLLQLGNVATLVASSAEAAQEIMKTHDLLFSNRPNLTIPSILLYGCNDMAFARYGEYWRQLKAIVVIHLLSNTRVKSFRKVREEEMVLTIGVLGESRGSLVDLSASLASLAKNVICRVALGRKHDHGSKFTELFRNLTEVIGVFSVGNYISWLSWVDRLSGLEGKARKIAKEFDEFLEGVLEEHANKGKRADAKSDEGKDLVDILLDVQRDNTTGFTLQRDNLKGVILDVFGGAIDNIFVTLEWAISELIRHPTAMRKLQQEVTELAQGRSMISEEDLEKMDYLRAVIKETLRLHVPLPLLLPRESTQDVKLMGYDIPAGTQVIINAWAIGRDSTSWEESMKFMPERFLNDSIDYKGLRFEWLPFGAGRRGCPGIQFGIVVIELALANIVYKFDLELPNGARYEDLDMSETNGLTVYRKSSLLVKLSAR